MKLQAILSSAALIAAMSFTGTAVAQNMIGDIEVPGEQVQAFKDACAALEAKSTASLTTEDSEDLTTGSTTSDDSQQSSSGDPASQDYWDNLMAGLTLEQCEAGGFMAM